MNAGFPVDTEAQLPVLPIGHVKSRITVCRLSAANGTSIPIYSARQLQLNLRSGRWNLWVFVLANVPTFILGIDFLHHYQLLVGASRLQMFDRKSDIKLKGSEARALIYRIAKNVW